MKFIVGRHAQEWAGSASRPTPSCWMSSPNTPIRRRVSRRFHRRCGCCLRHFSLLCVTLCNGLRGQQYHPVDRAPRTGCYHPRWSWSRPYIMSNDVCMIKRQASGTGVKQVRLILRRNCPIDTIDYLCQDVTVHATRHVRRSRATSTLGSGTYRHARGMETLIRHTQVSDCEARD